MNTEELRFYGIDAEKGAARFFNDEGIYRSMLEMFLKDTSFQRTKAAYECGDYDALFRNAHELKGVSGNAAMPELFEATGKLVETLRSGKADPTDVDAAFTPVEQAFLRAKEGVELALGK